MELVEVHESWLGHHGHKKKNEIKSTSILNTIILKEKGSMSSRLFRWVPFTVQTQVVVSTKV